MIKRAALVFGSVALAATAPALYAHTYGAGGAGLGAGLAHPFLGIDHLLAMLAVGLWAAQQQGYARLTVPAAFVTAMTLGAAAGVSGLVVSGVEAGIAASVLVLGLLVAGRTRLPMPVGLALVASFAAFHGHAHGTELPPVASIAHYGLGMVLATVLLHGSGFLLGDRLQRLWGEAWVRAGGGAIATTGTLAWIVG
jgi:urease accessory protein